MTIWILEIVDEFGGIFEEAYKEDDKKSAELRKFDLKQKGFICNIRPYEVWD